MSPILKWIDLCRSGLQHLRVVASTAQPDNPAAY